MQRQQIVLQRRSIGRVVDDVGIHRIVRLTPCGVLVPGRRSNPTESAAPCLRQFASTRHRERYTTECRPRRTTCRAIADCTQGSRRRYRDEPVYNSPCSRVGSLPSVVYRMSPFGVSVAMCTTNGWSKKPARYQTTRCLQTVELRPCSPLPATAFQSIAACQAAVPGHRRPRRRRFRRTAEDTPCVLMPSCVGVEPCAGVAIDA